MISKSAKFINIKNKNIAIKIIGASGLIILPSPKVIPTNIHLCFIFIIKI